MAEPRRESDFGLTGLTRRFQGKWAEGGTAREVVAGAAAEDGGAAAEDILADAVRLLESGLAPEVLMTLWLAATGRNHSPDRAGMDGRQWLGAVAEICAARRREDGPGPGAGSPEPARDAYAQAVLDEISLAGAALTVRTEEQYATCVPGVVPALRQAVQQVGPDLAFRLLLRVLDEYWVPISATQYDRYRALGERFGYGPRHVAEVRYLTTAAVG
ncbi:hypothetical protein OG900_12295 [Streptomyces sp. NBC_00433]